MLLGDFTSVTGGVDVPQRVVVCVEVAVQAGRVVGLAEEGVLRGEARRLWVVEPCLGKPELGFFVVDVAGETKAVLGGFELAGEAVVPPGVQVVAGRGRAGVVCEVDDGPEPIEGEVLSGFVCSGQADEAIGSDRPIQEPGPSRYPTGAAGSTLDFERIPAFGGRGIVTRDEGGGSTSSCGVRGEPRNDG